jgi:lipopolysaccharide biosynthesis regulator YciM
MSRLTKKCGDCGYTVPGLNSVVKDNAEIIGKMINKLAAYENLGSVEEIVQKINELEVYKRALEMACLTIGEWEQVSATNEGQIKYFLQEARKELEDEKN